MAIEFFLLITAINLEVRTMERWHARVGIRVVFGSPGDRAEKTLGEIVRCNNVRAHVKILEGRGKHQAGVVFEVPYSLMEPAPASGDKHDVKIVGRRPLNGMDSGIARSLTLTINLENAAFEGDAIGEEVARILEKAAIHARCDGTVMRDSFWSVPLRDVNGNKVGSFGNSYRLGVNETKRLAGG
jgi:hypothetical protein